MNKDLTTREKAMLYALALFLLTVACVYLVILPTAAQTAELREAVELTRQSDREVRGAVKDMADVAAQLELLELRAGELAARQLPLMNNSELDALITGLLLQCGLSPQSLVLERPRMDYVPEKGQPSLPELNFETPWEGIDLPSAMQNTASAEFTGGLAAFARFVDEIDKIDGARLTYVSYSTPDEGESYSFSAGLVVYMDARQPS